MDTLKRPGGVSAAVFVIIGCVGCASTGLAGDGTGDVLRGLHNNGKSVAQVAPKPSNVYSTKDAAPPG